MENNKKIYRNSPGGYNTHQDYLERREKVYNPPPVTSPRISSDYYSIKKELTTYQIIDIVKKLVSQIDYFTYKSNIYKISDLPMETLYKDKDNKKKLISDEKLFSSTQKYFIDEHIQKKPTYNPEQDIEPTYNPNNINQDPNSININLDDPSEKHGESPIAASFYISHSSFGTKELNYKDILLYQQKVLKIMFYYFILKFNIEAKKSNYDLPYHAWTNYVITDYQLIQIKYHKILNLYYYTFIVEIFRKNKHSGYSIYLDMYFRPEKTQIWISKAILMGVIPQSEIVFKDLNYFNFKPGNKKGELYSNIEDAKNQILDNTYDKMKEYEYRNKNTQSVSFDILTRDFDLQSNRKCFKPFNEGYPDAKTSNDCLSIDPKLSKTGIWDKECKTNDECPFYKANKNYPNEFGGCFNGYCELPVGMNKIGFKHYTKDKPMCYNCNLKNEIIQADGSSIIIDRECSGIECYKCCDIQHNKNIYPNLKSPDFVFPKDQLERLKHKTVLESNKLKNTF